MPNLFSDVVLGAGYVPEEVGAEVDAEGLPLESAGGPDLIVPVAAAKQRLLNALDGDRDKAIEAWGDRGSTNIRTSELHSLIQVAKSASVIDAELVELSPDVDDGYADGAAHTV